MIKRIFLDHPASVGESYGEHRDVALGFAWELLVAGGACAVHAFVPALFKRTASGAIERLYDRLCAQRRKGQGGAAGATPLDRATA